VHTQTHIHLHTDTIIHTHTHQGDEQPGESSIDGRPGNQQQGEGKKNNHLSD